MDTDSGGSSTWSGLDTIAYLVQPQKVLCCKIIEHKHISVKAENNSFKRVTCMSSKFQSSQ